MKTKATNQPPVCIRLRLTTDECAAIDRVRQFLGLPSVSSAAHRLAVWNARNIAAALDTDARPDALADAVGLNVGDLARLVMRQAITEGGR